jgi:hypothetical protein
MVNMQPVDNLRPGDFLSAGSSDQRAERKPRDRGDYDNLTMFGDPSDPLFDENPEQWIT